MCDLSCRKRSLFCVVRNSVFHKPGDVMRNRVLLLITVAFVFSSHAFASLDYDNWPDVTGPYFGQEPPGMTAEIFAPGIISTDRSEINSVFAPDRDEFYFTAWSKETGTKIMVTKMISMKNTMVETLTRK